MIIYYLLLNSRWCGFVLNHRTTIPRYGSLFFFFSPQYIMQPVSTDISLFTIWYCSILPMSDPMLDIQSQGYTASHFLCSSLVDQLYAKGVYFCSFMTKSNQACTKYSPKNFQQFLHDHYTHTWFQLAPSKTFCSKPTPPAHQQLKHYKLENEQN